MAMRRSINWLIARASRDTSSGQFIAEIDGLRFVAIAAVVLFHLGWYLTSKTGRVDEFDPLAELLSRGYLGVQLFFVISGFVIALPFARGHLFQGRIPRIREFFFRRLTRLEPPYIVNLLFRFAMLCLLSLDSAGNLLPHLLASVGYLHNIIYARESTVNFVAWSLEIEFQFYLLAPFICSVFLVRSRPARRSLLVVLMVFFTVLTYFSTSPRYHLSLFCALKYFLTGFLLVDIYLVDWKQKPACASLRWDLVSLLAWCSICALSFQGKIGELFLSVPIFLAYLAAFKGPLSNRFFCRPLIYSIGGMCYTIYLYHYSLISALGRFVVKLEPLSEAPLWLFITVASLVILPVTLLFCTIMFILVEKPCMKKDWYLRRSGRLKPGTDLPV
jgi:peptidoglycan/LPS O-acetylase OafA/YrhL